MVTCMHMQKHKLVVVEADDKYVELFTVDNIHIYFGESYSIRLTTTKPPHIIGYLSR